MIGYFLSSIVRFELNETLPLVSFFWTTHTAELHQNCTPESLTLMQSMGMSDVRRTRGVHNGDLSISLVFQHATFLYFSKAINSIGRAGAPSVPTLIPITANQRKYPLPALYNYQGVGELAKSRCQLFIVSFTAGYSDPTVDCSNA